MQLTAPASTIEKLMMMNLFNADQHKVTRHYQFGRI